MMNDDPEPHAVPVQASGQTCGADTAPPVTPPFFQRTDWLSFGLTGVLTLGGYLFTLAPNVTLGFSGIFSVGAMYAGVPHPPGYPLWTLWAWSFIKLLPFSNTAWRAGVASAVAGALACGMVALLVSRVGSHLVKDVAGSNPLAASDERNLRIVCGAVAGMGLGFDGAFWWKAVIADPWPLSILLLAMVLCFVTRWLWEPNRSWPLYCAFLFFGLAVTNSQALIPAGLSLPVIVFLNRPRNVIATLKLGVKSAAMFVLGVSLCLYVPIASMTNPPVNWGYPRTVEGFYHVLSRGQYERVHPTSDLGRLLEQLGWYAELAARDFGWLYLAASLVPFCVLRRVDEFGRRWMLAMTTVFLCLSVVMVALLNPANDRHSREVAGSFYTASHLVLAVWAGCGLMLIARRFVRSRTPTG